MSVRGTSAIVWYALYRCGTTARLYVEVVAVVWTTRRRAAPSAHAASVRFSPAVHAVEVVAVVFVVGWMFTLQSQLTYLLTPQNSDISEMTYYVSRGT